MKRSRASLMLFLMTICCALHTVGWSSSRAATTDVRPLQRLCTADWSPLGDCRAGVAPAASLASNGNVQLLNSSTLDACHPEAMACSYQSTADYTPGVDCFGTPTTAAAAHEVDSPPIEEYVYGDPAAEQAADVASSVEQTDCYCEYGCCPDEFDCGIVYVPKVYREDLSALASDPRHSTGLQLANEINANNDGLAEARLSSMQESVAPRIAAHVGANYDYGDCSGECYEDGNDDRLAHDLADLCGAGHCRVHTGDAAPVVTIDEEPLDLPPAEPAAVDPAEYGYADEYNYEDDYSYSAADQYNYENDYSYSAAVEYNYENDYSYGYEDDYSYGGTAEFESADAEDDYGYGYTDDEEYVYEGAQEPTDLPPGEQIIDDMPPGEALPAQAAYDPYDVECYGDYRATPPAPKAWIEPGCDEQQSYDAEDWCDGLTDDERSWGVGREYQQTAAAESAAQRSRELLHSTARVLNQLGETLLDLARSIDPQVEPVAETPAAMPAQELYPWPATLGRHPKIDPPLGL